MPTCFLNIINYDTRCKHFSAQTTLWNTSLIVSDYVFILFLINKNMWTHLHRQGMYELVCLLWNLLTCREFKSLTQTSCSAWGRLNKEVMRGQRGKKNPTETGSVDDHSRCGECVFALDSSEISLFVWIEHLVLFKYWYLILATNMWRLFPLWSWHRSFLRLKTGKGWLTGEN